MGKHIRFLIMLLAAAALLLEGEAVCTFGNLGVSLVSSHGDAVESAVTLAVHVVLAGYYIAFDRRILHNLFLLNSRISQNSTGFSRCPLFLLAMWFSRFLFVPAKILFALRCI